MTSSGPEQTPDGPEQPDAPGPRSPAAGPATAGRSRRGRGRGALGRADLGLVAGTLIYLLFMILPWYRVDPYDLGSGYSFPGSSANGFDSGLVVAAFVLLMLATGWALLPAFVEVPVPFPRALITVVLAVVVLLLTLVEWLSDVDDGFTLMGLLTLLSSVAVLALAVLRLLAELRERGGPGAQEPTSGPGA
jgi:hypothetical protein